MPNIQRAPPKLPSLSEDDASRPAIKSPGQGREVRAAYRREQEEARRLAAAKAGEERIRRTAGRRSFAMHGFWLEFQFGPSAVVIVWRLR